MSDVVSPARKPLPGQDTVWAPHWAALARHSLQVQHCAQCNRFQFPPAWVCAQCTGPVDWREVSGAGVVHTFNIEHVVYHPGFADEVPYNVSVVQLDEGPYLLTNVVDIDNADLHIGVRVQVRYDDIADGATLAKFAPTAGGHGGTRTD